MTPTWNLKGFIDNNETKWKTKEDGYIVLSDCEYLKQQENAYAVCAVGNAKVRKQIIEKLSNSDVRFATIVDPSVIFQREFQLARKLLYVQVQLLQ